MRCAPTGLACVPIGAGRGFLTEGSDQVAPVMAFLPQAWVSPCIGRRDQARPCRAEWSSGARLAGSLRRGMRGVQEGTLGTAPVVCRG